MRHIYVVTYDVCDPKRLRMVFKTMKGFGSHLQLSVFQCDLTPKDLVDMMFTLRELIDPKSDQILIMDLGPSEGSPIKNIQYIGKLMTVARRGATIV